MSTNTSDIFQAKMKAIAPSASVPNGALSHKNTMNLYMITNATIVAIMSSAPQMMACLTCLFITNIFKRLINSDRKGIEPCQLVVTLTVTAPYDAQDLSQCKTDVTPPDLPYNNTRKEDPTGLLQLGDDMSIT